MYCDRRLGDELWYLDKPFDADMRIPDRIKECVCFLCVRTKDKLEYGGTAFFVQAWSDKFGSDLSWTYLVTAKHCVERAMSRYGHLMARVNQQKSGAVLIDLSNKWVYHDQESSDVAVLEWSDDRPLEIATIRIPKGCATTTVVKDAHIGIGEDLFIAGLFTQRHGTQRNIPIVRTGVIASMSDEPLVDAGGMDYNAYLVEVRSIGGLSGSPVFVHIPPDRLLTSAEMPKGAALLLGVIRSHWDLTNEESAIDFALDFDAKLNMGIAAVTPIQEVVDIVMSHNKLLAKRRADELAYARKHAPTEDSAFGQVKQENENTFTKADFEAALKKVARKIEAKKSG